MGDGFSTKAVKLKNIDLFNSHLLIRVLFNLTAFQVQLSGEGQQKEPYIREVITWSIFNLLRPLETKFMY